MTTLFSPYSLRSVQIRNRIVMSPMCMYSAGDDGILTDWHLAHYHARAIGGVGLIILEATSVEPRARISRNDLGLWDDSQIEGIARLANLVHAEGAAIGIQLAHAGRKAVSGERGAGPQQPVAPSPLPFDENWVAPAELSIGEIERVITAWRSAAERAAAAKLDVIEIHAAHGYLNHQFLSPIANHRTDEYGGPLENRLRLLLQITEAVRQVWPADKPLLVRLSVTDWVTGGLTPDDQVLVAQALRAQGVDLIDCSSGGIVPVGPPQVGPGYQVPFAAKLRREADIPTAAVGLITDPHQANDVILGGHADLVALGRELLRHPYWALNAACTLGAEIVFPLQYRRAWIV